MCCTAQALVTLRCKIATGGHTSCGMCGVQSGQQQDASGGWFNGCGLGGPAALRGLPTAEVISRRVRSAHPLGLAHDRHPSLPQGWGALPLPRGPLRGGEGMDLHRVPVLNIPAPCVEASEKALLADAIIAGCSGEKRQSPRVPQCDRRRRCAPPSRMGLPWASRSTTD
jgi:hypothetical protein